METEFVDFEDILFNVADDYCITDTLDLHCKYLNDDMGWVIHDPTLFKYVQKTDYGLTTIKEATKYLAFIVNHKNLDNVYNFCKDHLKMNFVVERVLHDKGRKAATLLITDDI